MGDKIYEKHLDPSNEYAKLSKETNKEEIKKNLNQLDNHPGLKLIIKEFGDIKSEEEKLIKERYIRELIIEKGEEELVFWKRLKYFSFFLGILFLLVLYFSFWFIAKDLTVAEESFTNLFCLS